jgi:SlyX protein
MNDSASQESARLDALEMRIAHQDNTIADINEVITAQWRTIDALQRRVAELLEEFRSLVPARTIPEAPPPHY